MKLTIEVWRQAHRDAEGRFERHDIDGVEPHLSVLELLDALNEQLIDSGNDPVAFESDCREGICGACGVTVDGAVHGPEDNVPSCHQRLVGYPDGANVRIEPLRRERSILHRRDHRAEFRCVLAEYPDAGDRVDYRA